MGGDKIYAGDGLRILACTEGHAKAALQRVNDAVAKEGGTPEQRDAALRIFNARPVEAPVTAADDYDIDF